MRRLSLIAAGILAASGATAGSFNLNNPQLNAMGGAGVSSSSRANPALITPGRAQNSFELNLGAVSFYVEDPQGFAGAIQDFLDDDLIDRYADYDVNALSTSLGDLSDQADITAQAADDYQDDPTPANRTNLDTERDNLETQTSASQDEVDVSDTLIRDTQTSLDTFSDKPINGALMASLGLAMPRGNVPFSVSVSNNTYGGARLNVENDTRRFLDITEDTDEYLERLNTLNTRLGEFIDAVDDHGAGSDEADEAYANYEAAQTAFNEDTSNGVYVGGELDSEALTFESDEFDSNIEVLAANISEVSLATGMDMPNDFGNLSFGAAGKVQYIMVSGSRINVNDFENTDQITDNANDNLESYFTGNIDLGVSQTFTQIGVGTVAVGAVVRDVIPQTFEAGDGQEVNIGPKVRAGVSHYTPYSLVSVDIDLTENEAVGYGVDTRYLSLGMELDAFGWAQVRAGFRNNLAVDDASVVSGGLGFSPWGASLDLAGWFKPNFEDEIDLALNAGFSADLGISF